MDKKIGYEAIVKVNGFQDARHWIQRMVRAGIVECSSCAKPATHVYWQDQAEWYPHCEDHRDSGDQWTGSTHWNPVDFGLTVLPEAAKAWHATLSPDEADCVTFEEFDATNYWELIQPNVVPTRHYLEGDENSHFHLSVDIHLLKNGEYAWTAHKQRGNTGYGYGFFGAWVTETEALAAATKSLLKDKTA